MILLKLETKFSEEEEYKIGNGGTKGSSKDVEEVFINPSQAIPTLLWSDINYQAMHNPRYPIWLWI